MLDIFVKRYPFRILPNKKKTTPLAISQSRTYANQLVFVRIQFITFVSCAAIESNEITTILMFMSLCMYFIHFFIKSSSKLIATHTLHVHNAFIFFFRHYFPEKKKKTQNCNESEEIRIRPC